MTNKEKLKKIIDGISRSNPDYTFVFQVPQKEVQRVADNLKGNNSTKDGGMDTKKVTEIEKQIQSIFDNIDSLKKDLKKNEDELTYLLNQESDESTGVSSEQLATLSADIENKIKNAEDELKKLIFALKEESDGKDEEMLAQTQTSVSELEKKIEKLRIDTMTVVANVRGGGGNMNRNILVGGNSSTLGRYTDLNIKAGSNVTLTYVNNDNLKTTDLTIAATGGGGGSGVTRSISTVSVSSVIGEVALTDYVVVAGVGIQLTMPTAVSNTNLYTIKNKSTSSVLLVPNGSETIDGAANIILATQYTSIDLSSDNANWQIT